MTKQQHLAKLTTQTISIRPARLEDIDQLLAIEEICFICDALTQRSFKHFISAKTAEMRVLEKNNIIQGYGLVLFHHGRSLSRIYSIAVHPDAMGQGYANKILDTLEAISLDRDKLFIRLEVSINNRVALHVYKKRGYETTAQIPEYYADKSTAIRMEKRLLRKVTRPKSCHYIQQSTEFTCGPAALLMAMKSLNKTTRTSIPEELNIWREATTIFMASGHGGTSPLGLALAAHNRSFNTELWMSGEKIPFINTMRTPEKKMIYKKVHTEFERQLKEKKIPHKQTIPTLESLEHVYQNGATAIVLISTYQLNREKTPHWIWVVRIDSNYVYINDPYNTKEDHVTTDDSIFVPVPREIFKKMMKYGSKKLSAAIILHSAHH